MRQRKSQGKLENSLKLMQENIHQILWDTAKTGLGRKFIGSNTSIKKERISQINNLMPHLMILGKKGKLNLKEEIGRTL